MLRTKRSDFNFREKILKEGVKNIFKYIIMKKTTSFRNQESDCLVTNFNVFERERLRNMDNDFREDPIYKAFQD